MGRGLVLRSPGELATLVVLLCGEVIGCGRGGVERLVADDARGPATWGIDVGRV